MDRLRTIKISEENYKWLLRVASDLQKKKGEKISFDDTLKELKNKKTGEKKDIMALAGRWKISETDANNLIENIYKERKIISGRL